MTLRLCGRLLPSDLETMFSSQANDDFGKPIAIASLAVSDVTGTLNSMIPAGAQRRAGFENQNRRRTSRIRLLDGGQEDFRQYLILGDGDQSFRTAIRYAEV
jgi:hypothetical protein